MVIDFVCGETVTGKMGRSPCSEGLGLNKGLWTREEDLILINHINKHGHKNWRALPTQAGNNSNLNLLLLSCSIESEFCLMLLFSYSLI